jgi:hypothetical protein
MRRWTNTSGFPLCPEGEVIVGRGQCLAPTETLAQDTRCCTELPEVYEPGVTSRFGYGEFSISRYVWQDRAGDRTARGYHYTAVTLNHHMALQHLLSQGEELGEEHRLIGASSTDPRWTFNGSHIANDFSREAVFTNITGANNTHALRQTSRRLTAPVSTWLAGAIESTQQAFLQLWA